MTIKAYDGSTWQTQKALKIYNGSAWASAKQAWIYNGTSWVINYPEFPSASSNPGISVTSGVDGRIGCTYSASTGSWNSNEAYNPTSYTYQWTRSNVDIPGATTSTYTTNGADAEKVIGIKIKATNQRGDTTTSSTTGSTMLPIVTSLTATNTTQSVSAPSVTFTPSNLTYSGSWTSVSNATNYETSAGGTAGTPSVDVVNRLFSGTGTAGSASFSVRAVNTNRTVSLSWGSAAGAVSYDIYVNGSPYTNTSSTTYTYSAPDDNARNFTVYPRSTNIQGYGATTSSPVAALATYSSYGTGSGTLVQPNATSPTYASGSASTSNLSVYWGGSTSATKYRVYWTGSSSISLDPAVNYDSPEWTGTSASYNGSFTEGYTYYFYISASGDNNVWTPYGAYKASAAVAYTAPGMPGPSGSNITENSFLISWAAVSGASSYAVSVGTSYGGSNIVNTSGNTGTSYGVTGLSASTTYYITVTAYKTGYGYGSGGTTSVNTTASSAYYISTPTTPTFYRSGTTVKWGFDNPYFSGAFNPFGVEWQVGNNQSTANISSGNTKSYSTTNITTSGLPSYWHYIVSSSAGDIPSTSSPRYLRFRLYGQNTTTYASIDGPWSAWSA